MKMSLEALRQRVIFHNSIDVWIAVADDRGIKWNDTENYRKFIAYLLANGLNLKAFTLCAHEAGAVEQEKTDFVDTLAQIKEADPNAATYTVRLTDPAMAVIRNFSPESPS